jgi:hypothetical protein
MDYKDIVNKINEEYGHLLNKSCKYFVTNTNWFIDTNITENTLIELGFEETYKLNKINYTLTFNYDGFPSKYLWTSSYIKNRKEGTIWNDSHILIHKEFILNLLSPKPNYTPSRRRIVESNNDENKFEIGENVFIKTDLTVGGEYEKIKGKVGEIKEIKNKYPLDKKNYYYLIEVPNVKRNIDIYFVLYENEIEKITPNYNSRRNV